MAESSSKDELFQLIKRFGAYITFKVSNFLTPFSQNMDSRSVSAIAGLAIAVVFTWRLLRSPTNTQRRQPKRSSTRASSSGINVQPNTSLATYGIATSSDDTRTQSVDDFIQPVKVPTLGQIVRQKLNDGRKVGICPLECSCAPIVTCRLVGIILEETTPEDIQKQVTVRSSVLEVMLEITKYCDLYLMERVVDDESERKILQALEDAGVFASGGLVKDKVLFCSTESGRTSFVRQLEPDWHIDTNPEIISQLARFIKYQLHVSPNKPERTAANVYSATSLEQFFGFM
ncbi:Peroxisome biogenesis protein 22-like protein [Drosera capensis]